MHGVFLSASLSWIRRTGCWREACCSISLLRGAESMARTAGRPPPLGAYGALLAGHARRRNTGGALAVLQEFWERGGAPDAEMFDTVVDLCVRTGEFRRAMQVCCACPPSPPLQWLRSRAAPGW